MINRGDTYEIEIIDITNEGEGIGKLEGMAVFIPDTIPGDIVLAEIMQIKKKFARALPKEITTPSPQRISPACDVATTCGGCNFQFMSYEGQIVHKKKWITDCLARIGGIENPKVLDVMPMENPWLYRNKAQYAVGRISGSEKKHRGCNIGFYKRKSQEIINCETCLLQTDVADHIVQAIREFVKESKLPIYDVKSGTGILRNVVIKTAFGTGEIMIILVAAERKIPNVEVLVGKIQSAVEEFPPYSFESLILNVNKRRDGDVLGKDNITLAGKSTILDRLMGMDFEISPLSFYQVNPVMTEKLYSKVLDYAELTGNEVVIDLYCGVGTVGLLLAKDAKRVIGIESVKAAVIDANRNATINGIVNAEFICGRAEEELPKLLGQGIQADVIILDPPRSGCDLELLKAAASAGAQRIVYVSCDPATLARDVKILTQLSYGFVEAQPVDMFPHTGHVETCVLLSHKKSQASSPSL